MILPVQLNKGTQHRHYTDTGFFGSKKCLMLIRTIQLTGKRGVFAKQTYLVVHSVLIRQVSDRIASMESPPHDQLPK